MEIKNDEGLEEAINAIGRYCASKGDACVLGVLVGAEVHVGVYGQRDQLLGVLTALEKEIKDRCLEKAEALMGAAGVDEPIH